VITARRVRLCLKDLYHQDVIEMIERETRKYKLWVIEDPSDPHFEGAYNLLWEKFGPSGEMERREAIEAFLREDSFEPMATGTFIRYFLIVATDKDGVVRGVRDGSILVNPSYAPDLCVVYLSHIYMLEEARGTVLSYWLRISPMEIAVQYLADLHAKNLIELPHPKNPGRTFGMRITLAAEMEYWAPEDPISLQRILFYGRGGFDVINPAHFPYRQPDFRDPEVIRATGNQPLPFMLLLRRMGREREASLPISEAEAIMRLIYDDFAAFCAPEHLENSLDIVLSRLERQRDRGKTQVETAWTSCSAASNASATGARPRWSCCRCPRARGIWRVSSRSSATRCSSSTTRARPRPCPTCRAAWPRRWRPTGATSTSSSRPSPRPCRAGRTMSMAAGRSTSTGMARCWRAPRSSSRSTFTRATPRACSALDAVWVLSWRAQRSGWSVGEDDQFRDRFALSLLSEATTGSRGGRARELATSALVFWSGH